MTVGNHVDADKTALRGHLGDLVVTAPSLGTRGDVLSPACPTRQLLDRIGTKWTSLAIKALADAHPEEVRFAPLRRLCDFVILEERHSSLQTLYSLEYGCLHAYSPGC